MLLQNYILPNWVNQMNNMIYVEINRVIHTNGTGGTKSMSVMELLKESMW